MHAAIYARVSTERQGRQQTIDSQLEALRTWARQQGHELTDEHVFRDEGASGSRLDRPGLDALRDAVRDAAIDILAVLSPDRLARKYAYQVLLLEEFRRAGCEVVFLHHPISDDPNDQLLLQIQGAIAEYERAVLRERFRRGKLQKARAGCWLAGRPPYGYRYVPRRETVPGYLVVEETEAELVRLLYGWLVEERMTIRQIVKRLNAGPWFPRSGRHPWSPTTVHHILSHPVYTGTGYANQYAYVPPKKPRRPGRRGDIATCRQLKPKEEWIPIPAPVIIDQAYWDRAQAQLAVNAKLSFRHNTKYSYLLRCLLTCGTCGLAMFGRTYKARARQAERRCYCCHGKDCIVSARESVCPARPVQAAELEAAVWEHVVGLLGDPAQLAAQFTRCVTAGTDDDVAHGADEQLAARWRRLERQEARLLDAYQAEVIDLAELAARRRQLGQQRDALERQRAEQQRRRQRHRQTQEVLSSLAAFVDRLQARLHAASLADQRAILELVIDRIIVHADTGSLEIRHVIPLRSPSSGRAKPAVLDAQLRSDGVNPTTLMSRRREDLLERLPEAERAIADRQLGCDRQATGLQPDQQLPPTLGTLSRADLEADQLLLALGRSADDHQHALGLGLQARLQVDAIGPEIDIAPGRQVALLPALVLGLPVAPQPGDHRRREVRGVLAEESGERFLEVAGRDPAQVQDRQQRVDAPAAPCPARQNPRREADPIAGRGAVAHLHPPYLDRADPGLDGPLRAIAVADDAGPPIGEPLVRHRRQEGFGLRLDRLGEQAPRTCAQHCGQWVIHRLGLRETDNGAILVHGVSLRLEVLAGWLPASIRRLPQTVVTQLPP